MGSRKSSVTVADVARAAKVSKATAARVLGGYGIAGEASRAAVLAAAEALGYRPNELARSMSTGRSGLVGVVVGDIENAFFAQAVRGISDRLRSADLNLIISNSSEDLREEVEMVSVLLRQRVAGMIVAPTDMDQVDHLRAAMAAGTALVTLDRWVPGLGADAVCGTDRASAAAVLARLQAAGHRRVAYVTAVPLRPGQAFAPAQVGIAAVRERIEGFLSATAAAGVEGAADLVFPGATGEPEVERIVARLLASRPRITAVMASDSLVGARIFRALTQRGLALPRDMSLVSWFDADWTSVTRPQISVVDQPTYRFGARAAERLIARIGGDGAPPRRHEIATPLIERGTIGPPPAD
ncbi:LacI family DNA-binding transcriptional regulator [Frigidibacter sp. MR17.24]|uniref:LacI family DNA-binding transcriptional regulator n=1 Tax=Frigidibacter sp. MR17.24 TaxID=3127345 RepID=UPI003012A08F